MSDETELWRDDQTYLEAGVFGMAFGALFTFIILLFYRGTSSLTVSDIANVIIAVTAVVAMFVAKGWRREAVERRKAELAIRILNAAVDYADFIKEKARAGDLTRRDSERPIEREYHRCGRFVAAFFPSSLETYERLDKERSAFAQEIREDHFDSATLDEVEAALFESIGELALFGAKVTMPVTDARRFRKWFETGEGWDE